jgi:hypothetical protein
VILFLYLSATLLMYFSFLVLYALKASSIVSKVPKYTCLLLKPIFTLALNFLPDLLIPIGHSPLVESVLISSVFISCGTKQQFSGL